ncbi:MAG TPA: amidohydrolase family protein [Myxococcaceae bacterium]|nr:amidohydrolase family protein [Myxococcaceae bacterium]
MLYRGRLLFDAHTHLLPDRLALAIRSFVSRAVPSLPYPPTAVEARAALVHAGVQRCVSLPYAHKGGISAALNRDLAERWRGDPMVIAGATVHPEDDVAAVVAEACDVLGARVFKLHCSVGRYEPDDPRLDPVYARELPVVVHVGHAVDGSTAAGEPERVVAVARRWPRTPLVIAHFGAPAVAETEAVMRACPNVHADLAPILWEPPRLTRALIRGLEERIMFGSDVPTVKVRLEDGLQRVRDLHLGAEAEAAILGGNAARLYGAA